MTLRARRRPWAALTAALLLVLAAVTHLTATAPPAAAAGTCSGLSSNYFNGYYYAGTRGSPHYYEGSSAYIVVRNGANCGGDSTVGNFTNSWVMIAGNLGPDYNGWGQVGFERTANAPSSGLRWFSQFYDGFDGLDTRYSAFADPLRVNKEIGVRHAFRVLWNESCRCLRATIDSTTWDSSNFNPFAAAESNWGPQPWSPQFLAETGYLQSDVPGSATAPTRFSALGVQRTSDDRLQSIPCILSAATDTTRWKRRALSCTSFDVWTG